MEYRREPTEGLRLRCEKEVFKMRVRVAVLVMLAIPLASCGSGVTATPGSTEVIVGAGLYWERVPVEAGVFGENTVSSVTAGGPGLVAVGYSDTGASRSGVAWASEDGHTWTRVEDEAFGGTGDRATVLSVTAGGPGLVAVGMVDAASAENGGAAVWVSEDGYAWARVLDEALGWGDQYITSVTAGGPGLVAGGGDSRGAAVWVSENGYDWTRIEDPDAFAGEQYQAISSVTAGGPGLVAVGSEGMFADEPRSFVWVSADGYTWTRLEAPFGEINALIPMSVTAAGPGLVAVGWGAPPVWVSQDGYTWTPISDEGAVFGSPGELIVFDVAAGGPGLVAVGEGVWVSQDGLSWTRIQDEALVGADRIQLVAAWSRGLIAMATQFNALWVSPPGG